MWTIGYNWTVVIAVVLKPQSIYLYKQGPDYRSSVLLPAVPLPDSVMLTPVQL